MILHVYYELTDHFEVSADIEKTWAAEVKK